MELPTIAEPEVIQEIPVEQITPPTIEPIDNGQSMAVDFADIVPPEVAASAELILDVQIETIDMESLFAPVSEVQFDAIMAVQAVPFEEVPFLDPIAEIPVALEEPALPALDLADTTALAVPEVMAMEEMVWFRRRRLAAVGINKEADVYYHAKVVSGKGAAFKVDIRFSDPAAVKNAKINFNLSGKNGFKAKMGVPLPAQFASAASASKGQVFSDVVLVLFLINMFLIAVTGAGW